MKVRDKKAHLVSMSEDEMLKVLQAMDFIVSYINDEHAQENWLYHTGGDEFESVDDIPDEEELSAMFLDFAVCMRKATR